MYLAHVKDHKLHFPSAIQEQKFFEQCEGKRVKIEKIRQVRSLPQNALYWVYLHKIAEETGNEEEDLHEFFKHELLPHKLVCIKGKAREYRVWKVESTRNLSKADFSAYMAKIERLTGILIPNMEEAGYISNYGA